MSRKKESLSDNFASLSALDVFANTVGVLGFLLLLFAANAIELVHPSPLKIVTKKLPISRSKMEYIGILSAIGGVSPYSWKLRTGSLPDGLILDGKKGEIIGNASTSASGETFSFQVEVNDAHKKKAYASLNIRVFPEPEQEHLTSEPLVILTHGELPVAFIDKPYSIYLSARGGSGKYQWSIEGLPQNFTLQPCIGLLKGIPQAPGTYEFIIKVSDQVEGSGDAGQSLATAMLKIIGIAEQAQITGVLPSPIIFTENLPSAIENEPYKVQLAGVGQPPLNWSALHLPLGLRISNDGVIDGTPIRGMDAQISLKMSDARSLKAKDKTILLIIKPRPHSNFERFKKYGIWGWLGYLLIVLIEVAFIFLLNFYGSRHFDMILELHHVTYIKKPDGTIVLSGEKEAIASVERQSRYILQKHHRYKIFSYSILIVTIFGYTIFLLR